MTRIRPERNEGTLGVFIADDSEAVRRRLVELVTDVPGVQVVGEACDGTEVLESTEAREADLLILDVQMPGANGIEVLRRLQECGELPDVVVMLTAIPYPQVRRRCLELGATLFLDKTTDLHRLAGILGAVRDVRSGAWGGAKGRKVERKAEGV